ARPASAPCLWRPPRAPPARVAARARRLPVLRPVPAPRNRPEVRRVLPELTTRSGDDTAAARARPPASGSPPTRIVAPATAAIPTASTSASSHSRAPFVQRRCTLSPSPPLHRWALARSATRERGWALALS